MKHFLFFKVPDINAKVGIAMVAREFQLYFPAQGNSGGLVPRNPGRRDMHLAMVESAKANGGILLVRGFRAGKGKPYTEIPYPNYTLFRDLWPMPGAGKFAYWLFCNGAGALPLAKGQQFTSEEQCSRLAARLGLVPTKNARPVSVQALNREN